MFTPFPKGQLASKNGDKKVWKNAEIEKIKSLKTTGLIASHCRSSLCMIFKREDINNAILMIDELETHALMRKKCRLQTLCKQNARPAFLPNPAATALARKGHQQ